MVLVRKERQVDDCQLGKLMLEIDILNFASAMDLYHDPWSKMVISNANQYFNETCDKLRELMWNKL